MRELRAATAAVLMTVIFEQAGAADYQTAVEQLPAPFDAWNVTATPQADSRIVELGFDSVLLRRRAISHVYLPDAYATAEAPLPVAYFFHGTIRVYTLPGADDVFDGLAEQGVPLGYPFGPGNGRGPTDFVRHSLDRAEFVIVTPDSGPEPWCESCFFIDGYRGRGVAAESHFYEELIPLVEAVFAVRDDRAGRAVFGRSMGGGAALIHGLRHPDRFAFVGALSPSHIDWTEDPLLSYVLWKHYVDGQGYPPAQVAELTYRNLNPLDLAPNTIGTNQEIVIILGDGCVDHSEGACDGARLTDDPQDYFFGAGQEIPLRRNADQYVPRLLQLGVPIQYIEREGLHGAINRDGYERYLLPRMNRIFAEGVPDPLRFSYKTADRSFRVWGYDFEVDRPNEEFLAILGARLDGRELVLAGTGSVTVRTPSRFAPASLHHVVVTPLSPIPPLGEAPTEMTREADGEGRLEIPVVLGAPREIDERRELVDQGQLRFPQTRIEVAD